MARNEQSRTGGAFSTFPLEPIEISEDNLESYKRAFAAVKASKDKRKKDEDSEKKRRDIGGKES